jgi:hypothetical protein
MPMPELTTRSTEQRATGFGGAIGCSYRQAHNDLIFVEFAGKISRLSLVRPVAATVSSGTATLRGTWLFDFDAGVEGTSGDVWWEQPTAGVRSLEPSGGARIVNLGHVNYANVTPALLQTLAYGTTGIHGNNDATNVLTPGDVFAVRTNLGNYAKVQIVSCGYDLHLTWTTYRLASAYQVIGTGYNQPEDVVVTADETHAYVTERSGNLLRVDLSNANRGAAVLVHGGMTAPHQISLDEARNVAHVVEFANPGRLLRVDLGSGVATPVVPDLENAIGLIVTSNAAFAFVTEQLAGGHGRLSRIELATGRREILFTGSDAPLFFLRWSDPSEGSFLVTERDPSDEIWLVDLTHAPAQISTLVVGTAFRPSSVAVLAASDLLVCFDSEIDEISLGASSIYRASGDIMLGIGHVPATSIVGGYATTDPGYFFQVKDSPFGGTLPAMVNHDRAYADGARYYKVFIDGVEQRQPWSDYRLDNPTNKFVPRTVSPSATGFFPVRSPAELWYNHFLGYLADTSGLTNALHTIGIRLYAAANARSQIGDLTDPGRTVALRIDNRWPTAVINSILHDGVAGGACAVVTSGSSKFEFDVTASDPDGHLKSWYLGAMWGDNASAAVASDVYDNHLGGAPIWAGIAGVVTPPAPGWEANDGTWASTHCAHTFYLDVWDRVIDGWSYIHEAGYHKSITILLP